MRESRAADPEGVHARLGQVERRRVVALGGQPGGQLPRDRPASGLVLDHLRQGPGHAPGAAQERGLDRTDAHREPLGPRQAGQPAARHRLGPEDVDVGRVLDERPDPFDRGADVHGPSDGPLAHRLRGTSTEHARQRRQAGRLPQALGEIASGVGHGRGGPDSVEQMQTFLPYADFERSARVLDAKRLGKQRVEVYPGGPGTDRAGLCLGPPPRRAHVEGGTRRRWGATGSCAARCGPTLASTTRARPTCDRPARRGDRHHPPQADLAGAGALPPWLGGRGPVHRATARRWSARTPTSTGRRSPTCRTTCPTCGRSAPPPSSRPSGAARRPPSPRRAGGRAGADR